MVTRDGCHLCDEMEAVLREVLPALGAAYELVDVDGDPELTRRFGDVVPVLLRDGRPVAKVRVDPTTLRRLVARRL